MDPLPESDGPFVEQWVHCPTAGEWVTPDSVGFVTRWLGWRAATERALYGPDGFFRRPEGPAGHFRTSVHASARFAAAVLELARTAGLTTIVDMGAGRGELLHSLHVLDPALTLHGVEVAARPGGLPEPISWADEPPKGATALLVANEWLDNVPVDVVELTETGPALVEVDPASGEERLNGPPAEPDMEWLADWWPLAEPGDRAEVGRPRDEAWRSAIASLDAGVAVAIDYAHVRGARPPYGTLAGYRAGRAVAPVPDGSCDITAHVALDACAAAGAAAGALTTLLTTQRSALRSLGVRGLQPPPELAHRDPPAYMDALREAGEDGELLDPYGLGGFDWLVQTVAMPLPGPLADLENSEVRRPGAW